MKAASTREPALKATGNYFSENPKCHAHFFLYGDYTLRGDVSFLVPEVCFVFKFQTS
jgi:hypothetical protein